MFLFAGIGADSGAGVGAKLVLYFLPSNSNVFAPALRASLNASLKLVALETVGCSFTN